MKTIKIIDLLNKIANGEEVPDKVRYGGIIYTKAVDYVTKEVIDYLNHNESLFQVNDGFEYCFINKYLNDEVEIIEEDKKIEKLNVDDIDYFTMNNKINEIIDAINRSDK